MVAYPFYVERENLLTGVSISGSGLSSRAEPFRAVIASD